MGVSVNIPSKGLPVTRSMGKNADVTPVTFPVGHPIVTSVDTTLMTLPTTRSMDVNTTTTPPSSPSQTSQSFLGHHAQAIIDVNQKLKALGIDTTISLPQICVIGDQSAGKSSLIEAISDIQVPKADGTCTRCPVAINLSGGATPDSPFSCTVSIEQRYDYVSGRKTSATNPLGPWEKRTAMNVIVIQSTNDKNQIPELITNAQIRILDTSFQAGSPSGRKAKKILQFSPNVIRLDISEGVRPNLCFVDLPGVISNVAQRDDRYLIDLVGNLVREYAKDARNENILALPMSADVQTSKACSIVQDLQVESRTLPVFTKPDCVPVKRQEYFINQYLKRAEHAQGVADDEVTRFENGCFFVMLANSSSDQTDPRREEAQFFKKSVWATLPEGFLSRLGVPALREHLRSRLFHKTLEALPDNLKEIENELDRIDIALDELPDPPDKPFFCMEMQQVLEDFAREMAQKFSGDAEDSANGPLRVRFQAFQEQIQMAKPSVDHGTKSEKQSMKEAMKGIKELLKDRKPLKVQDLADDGCGDDTEGKNFSLHHLRNINKHFVHTGLPGDVDPRAVNKACVESLEAWQPLHEAFLKEMHEFFQGQITAVFSKVFMKYKNLGIYNVVEKSLAEFLASAMSGEKRLAEANSLEERSRPFTMDMETLDNHKHVQAEALMDSRRRFRLELAKRERDVEEGCYRKDRKDVTYDDLGPDEFKAEVALGARVLGYYEIASKRFIDKTCQGIYSRLLPICGEEIAADLKEHIKPRDAKNEDQIVQWLLEDPDKEDQRRQLQHKKEQLIEGGQYIRQALGTTTALTVSPSKRHSSPDPDGADISSTPSKRQRLVHRSGPPADDLPGGEDEDIKNQMEM